MNARPRSLLLIRPGALGDAVLTLPLIEGLRAAGIERVTVLGTPPSWGFLAPATLAIEDFGSRDWLGLFDPGDRDRAAASGLRDRFDAAIVALGRHGPAIAAALRGAGIERVALVVPAALGEQAAAADAPTATPRFTVSAAPWQPNPAHAACRLYAALARLDLATDASRWPAPPPSSAEDPLLRIDRAEAAPLCAIPGLDQSATDLLVIHPGSGGAAKCWPPERFAAIAIAARPRLRLRPALLLGPADAAIGRAVRAALPPSFDLPAIVDRSLREVVAILAVARAFLGNDSGVTHLAARATATLALFGPTDPRVWRPLGRRVGVLRAPEGRLVDLRTEPVIDALETVLRL